MKTHLSFALITATAFLANGCGGEAQPKRAPQDIHISEGPRSQIPPKVVGKEEVAGKEDVPIEVHTVLKTFTNGLGMKFVWIPPGSFFMGFSEGNEPAGIGSSQRKVTLTKGFYMGAYLVTQVQWQALMDQDRSRFMKDRDLPVDSVSWDDCQEFIERLMKEDDRPYRLPTEAEWEYACRAGTTTPFHFGINISPNQANYGGEATSSPRKTDVNRARTTPVDRFPPNAWGLFDMHGNLRQWCQDWDNNRGNSPPLPGVSGQQPAGRDLGDAVDPKGPEKGSRRVLRGGSWRDPGHFCRSDYRVSGYSYGRSSQTGFRLCFFHD